MSDARSDDGDAECVDKGDDEKTGSQVELVWSFELRWGKEDSQRCSGRVGEAVRGDDGAESQWTSEMTEADEDGKAPAAAYRLTITVMGSEMSVRRIVKIPILYVSLDHTPIPVDHP